MEELLNKLIEKGWKPFGHNAIKLDYDGMKTRYGYGAITYKYRDSYIDDDGDEVEYEEWRRQFNLRELVSKESGLWQFICENNLIQTEHGCFIDNGERAKNVFYKIDTYDEEGDVIQTGDMEGDKFIGINEYEYRLIESALCNEEDLEKFLLDNIKI